MDDNVGPALAAVKLLEAETLPPAQAGMDRSPVEKESSLRRRLLDYLYALDL